MNNRLLKKISSLVLLLVMLLNPLMSWAVGVLATQSQTINGSSSLSSSNPGFSSPGSSNHSSSSQSAMSALCHDDASGAAVAGLVNIQQTISVRSQELASIDAHHGNPTESDIHQCCDEPCQCGYNGCQAPLALLSHLDSIHEASQPSYHFSIAVYLNPTLASVTPPPIF